MSPGGLFAGTGPDGGDGPSCTPDATKVPVDDTSVTYDAARGSVHSLGLET